MSVSIWEGDKADSLISAIGENNKKLDNMTLMLAAIADGFSETEDGKGLYFKNFKTLQTLSRMGLAGRVLDSYSYVVVNKEESMAIAAHGTGVTGATINEETFTEEIGTAETKEYEFIYDGSAWKLNDETVILASYGITATGTPAAEDTIVVHENASAIRYDVLDIDHDIPVDPNFTHTITLCAHDCKIYNTLPYKRSQGLIYVDPTAFPSGLTAGEFYYIIGDHCSYTSNTAEDGMYGFTPTIDVPAGGLIRHTAMGAYQSTSTNYTQARVLAGTFTTYDTIANGRAVIESGLATSLADGQTGTCLGTVTAETMTYRSASYCNMTRRNAHGSNYYIGSDERAWMNSKAKAGVDAKGVQLWQSGSLGIFDIPSTANVAGNLHGVDPALLDVMGKVRKRTYLHPADRSDQSVKYADTEELVFPISMEEAGLGTTNDGVHENAVDAEGNVKTTPYAYYARRTTGAERIKYQNGTARYWWLRSPIPSHCSTVRYVNSSGALSTTSASPAYGAVDAFNIV